jgi:hypothetical protein
LRAAIAIHELKQAPAEPPTPESRRRGPLP